MGFSMTYDLEGAGWAMARIQDGEYTVDVTISYLHDTLRELGEAARALADGAASSRVVFMDEPGEVQMLLARRGDFLDYELRWFDDWNSWGMHPADKFTILHHGSTTIARFFGEVRKEFEALLASYGEEGYRERWVEHDFPVELLRDLQGNGRVGQSCANEDSNPEEKRSGPVNGPPPM